MTGEPFAHLGMFMGRVVVDDSVDCLSFWNLRLNGVEEADELLMAVTFHVVTDDGAIENVEGGEQRRGAMAFVDQGMPNHGSLSANDFGVSEFFWPQAGSSRCHS